VEEFEFEMTTSEEAAVYENNQHYQEASNSGIDTGLDSRRTTPYWDSSSNDSRREESTTTGMRPRSKFYRGNRHAGCSMTNPHGSNPEYTERLKREEQVAGLAKADASTKIVDVLNLKYEKEKLEQKRKEEKKERKAQELIEEEQRKKQAAEEALRISEQVEEMTEEEEWLLRLKKEERE
jgi:hypothetical protein